MRTAVAASLGALILFDGRGKVWWLLIVDKRGAAYVFDAGGGAFLGTTSRAPRTEHVGLLCLTREKFD